MFTQVFTAGRNETKSDEESSEWSPMFVKLANACSSKGDMPTKRSTNMCVLVKSILVKKIMKYLPLVSRDWKDCYYPQTSTKTTEKCETWNTNLSELKRVREMLKTINKESK